MLLKVLKGLIKLPLLFILITPLAIVDMILLLGHVSEDFPCVNFFLDY